MDCIDEIPFHRPHLTGTEDAYIAKALASGRLHGDGGFSDMAARRLAEITGSPAVLLTTSCTHALELAALCLGIGPGDEVVMPSFTFVSTANAFALRGARPVFVDIEPATLNVDPDAVAAALTDRTRAVVPVHYAGAPCDMDRLSALCSGRGLHLVEDAAHALGGEHRGRPLGSIGAFGALSFHDTKNVQCGEGGALLVNDPDLRDRTEVLREKGTNRRAFVRGEISSYSWIDVGSSYLLAEVLAAMLVAQLGDFECIQARRHQIWRTYHEGLRGWASEVGARLPDPPSGSVHAAHLFHILLPGPAERDSFLAHLRSNGIGAAFHYVPMHDTELGRRLGHTEALPVTESVASRLARLPLYPDLAPAQVDRVVDVVSSFRP